MKPAALIHYAARCADDSDGVMLASRHLVSALSAHLSTSPIVIGRPSPSPSQSLGWEADLNLARPDLEATACELSSALEEGKYAVTACSRCAVGLATIPAVTRQDVTVVWFDAHGDLNTPSTSGSGHLGGMALAGALGLWDSGLGGVGANKIDVVLAGTREFDTAEAALIERGVARVVPPGPDFAARLAKEVEGRRVYVHVDCDVLSPNELPDDEYGCPPAGLSLRELNEAAEAIVRAAREVLGIEVGEMEPGKSEVGTGEKARVLVRTLAPLLPVTSV